MTSTAAGHSAPHAHSSAGAGTAPATGTAPGTAPGPGSRSRAVQYTRYGGPGVLQVVEREDPAPGPGQVRLAVRAASVNPFDARLRAGLLASTDAPPAPVVPGTDVAGVVEALGAGVTTLSPGDEVFGRGSGGSHAEKAIAQVEELILKPEEINWEVAACLEVIVHTARSVLDDLRDPDDGLDLPVHPLLLVHGASGAIGTMLVQMAAARGATVLGTGSGGHQAALAALGVVPVVHGEGLTGRVRAAIQALSPNQGGPRAIDAIIDLPGKGPLAELVALAGDPRRVITIAHPDAGSQGVRFSGRHWVPGALTEVAGQIAAGTIRPPAIRTYPLPQAARAQEDNRTGAVSGKLALVP